MAYQSGCFELGTSCAWHAMHSHVQTPERWPLAADAKSAEQMEAEADAQRDHEADAALGAAHAEVPDEDAADMRWEPQHDEAQEGYACCLQLSASCLTSAKVLH